MINISLLRILSVAVLVLFLVLFGPQLNFPAQAPYCHVTLATGTSPSDKLLQDVPRGVITEPVRLGSFE
jgi:hypothetical protein